MSHVLLVGAGGNIGSHVVPLLTRIPEITRLTLVDRDVYEDRNRGNQDIHPGAIGRKKALVQVDRVRRRNPDLPVRAICEDIETMPLGAFRCDLLLAALDSRKARQHINQVASRLGIPWLDAGVLGGAMLARVTRYMPAEDLPCLECRWDAADYAAIEQTYPCEAAEQPPRTAPPPSSLGALAAALLALECRKLLNADAASLPPGSELVVDARHHRQFVSSARRNPACRFVHHAPWAVQPFPIAPRTALGAAFEHLGRPLGANGGLTLSVDGKRIVRRLVCEGCGAVKSVLRLRGALRPTDQKCSGCGGTMAINGFGLLEDLAAASLTRSERNRSLASIGIRSGEVVTVSESGHSLHFELVAP